METDKFIAVAVRLDEAINAYGRASLGADESEGTALMAAAMDARDSLFVLCGYAQAKAMAV